MPAQVSASKRVKSPKGLPVFKVAADKGTHPPVELDRAVCVVGRRGSAHLPLSAPQVSKVHALIVRDESSGHVYLRDLASTNGVEVNGAKISEASLGDADVIRIGAYTLRCESGFGDKNGEETNGTAASSSSGAEAPAAELSVAGQTVAIPRGKHTMLIGHRPACDVRLEDPSVAPVHAVLFEMDGKHYVRAFEAPGGTKLNGRPVEQQAELSSGDEIKVGKFAIHYEQVASPEPEPMLEPAPAPAAIAAEDDALDVTPVDIEEDHGEEITGDALVDLALIGEIEPDASHSHADVIEVGESAIAPAVTEAPPAPVAAATRTAAPPPLPMDHGDDLEVELEPLDDVSPAASHEELVELEPLAEAPAPAPAPATAPVPQPAPTRAAAPVPPKRVEPPPPPKPAKAAAPPPAPVDDFHVVVDDEDLTDITPFDLGAGDVETEAEAAPYVDPALEASFGAALKFDPATVAGEQDDILASLVTPSSDDADMNATFDESTGMSAVSPLMEAPIETPEPIPTPAAKTKTKAKAKEVAPEPFAAVEDEHDDDDDLDLVELSTPRGGGDDLSATVDETEDLSPLGVDPADAPTAVEDETEAKAEPEREPVAVADEPSQPDEVAPALAASTGGQAAGLEVLAERAGLAPDASAATPGINEIGAMLSEVVAKVEALKSAWTAYQAKAAASPARAASDADAE